MPSDHVAFSKERLESDDVAHHLGNLYAEFPFSLGELTAGNEGFVFHRSPAP
jgi:hypothetical protein